jgi:membrane-bound inhibitor of C-type lysozyme
MKNKFAHFHALAIVCALLVSACTEVPVRGNQSVNAPAMSSPKPTNNDAVMVSYACNSHKTIAVTYRSGGSDQTAKMVLEGKVLILTQVNGQPGSKVYFSDPYSMQVANTGDLRQAGMTVLKRQTRKVNGVDKSFDAPLLEDCRPK